MLSTFSVKNFKALEDVVIEPGLITVLIGPNGSGKSSVIQALGVLRQSRDHSALELRGPTFTLGTFEEVITRGDTSRILRFRLHLGVDENFDPFVTAGDMFEYAADFDQSGLLSHKGMIHLKAGDLSGGWSRYEAKTGEVGINTANVLVRVQGGGSSVGRPFETTSLAPTAQLSKAERDGLRQKWESVLSIWVNFLESVYFVPPLRGFARPSYGLAESGQTDLSPYAPDPGSYAAQALGSLAHDRELEDKVSSLVNSVLQRRIRARIVPQRNVSLEVQTQALRLNAVNEGFGVNQLVFPLLQVAAAPAGSLVAIEEPEIHLHPLAQGLLCEVLTEVAQQERKQLMLTTHSEHILIGFLNLVTTGLLKPTDVAVYYFEVKDRVANVSRLPVDDKGRVEGGLRGFFEADLEQLTKFFDALKKKGNQ